MACCSVLSVAMSCDLLHSFHCHSHTYCCSVLQCVVSVLSVCRGVLCVIVCCSMLQTVVSVSRCVVCCRVPWHAAPIRAPCADTRDAVCCSVLQSVAVCCSVLQCDAVCCSVMQCVAVWCSVMQCDAVWRKVMQCVAVCWSMLQCVAVCRSVMQCVAVCCSVFAACYVSMCCDLQCFVNEYCSALKAECVAVRRVYMPRWFRPMYLIQHLCVPYSTSLSTKKHCNTLQHPATPCNTLQHTASH